MSLLNINVYEYLLKMFPMGLATIEQVGKAVINEKITEEQFEEITKIKFKEYIN